MAENIKADSVKHHAPIIYQLYEELKSHVGKGNAISAEELSGKFGMTERDLRECISEIRNSTELEKIIGSCNGGYFICTEDEFKRSNNRLLSMAFSLLRTARANSRKAGLDGQFKMALGDFYGECYEPFMPKTNKF